MKLKIGEFSKINRITVKTLRHYEEIGIFMPSSTDEQTGYRYYSLEQISELGNILSFKKMGFSLDEIKLLLRGEYNKDIFDLKLKQLNTEKDYVEKKIRELTYFKKQFKGDFIMEKVVIKSLPKVTVASHRTKLNSYNDLFHLAPNVVGPEMVRLGCKCLEPSYCFNIYHDGECKETDIDVEICEAVVERREDSDIITFKEIDEVKMAATLMHKGSYDKLGESYKIILDYIDKNGFKIKGLMRESYIDGIWNKDDEGDWLTEIQIPVEKV